MDQNQVFLEEVDNSLNLFINGFEGYDGSIISRQKSFDLLNIEVASRTNDIEIGISDQRATELLGSIELNPIVINESGFLIEIVPMNSPKISFPRELQELPYYALMTLKILLKTAGQHSNTFILKQRLRFAKSEMSEITPQLMISSRFERNNQSFDPYLSIPVHLQRLIRRKLNLEFARAFENNPIKFSPFSLGQLYINLNPVISHFGYDKLTIVSKNLDKRKNSEPLLSSISNGFNQAIKINKTLFESEIRSQISNRATIKKIEFKRGYIDISTRHSERRSFLHISVRTKVRMDYRLYLFVLHSTELWIKAVWKDYEFKIDARNCWPICNAVIRIARKVILRIIERNKYFRMFLADLFQHSERVKPKISPFGVQIDLKI